MRILGFIRIPVLVSAIVLMNMLLPTANADTISEKREQASQIEAQLKANQAELASLTAAFSSRQSSLASVQAAISQNETRLEQAQSDLEYYRGVLNDRLVSMYKNGDSNAIEVILESRSLEDLLYSSEFMSRIGSGDASNVQNVSDLLSEIEQRRRELDFQRADFQAQMDGLRVQQDRIQAKLGDQESILKGINAEIAEMIGRNAGGGTNAGGGNGGNSSGGTGNPGNWVAGPVEGKYFPVAGAHSFTNDWGAPRVVGATHKGTDIMSRYGTPLVAITGGTVQQRSQKNAGLYIALSGDDGTLYYYMHMSEFAASGRVEAGQLIGYVGDSGNAKGTPHCHFEVHPGNGGPVNPYPLLVTLDG